MKLKFLIIVSVFIVTVMGITFLYFQAIKLDTKSMDEVLVTLNQIQRLEAELNRDVLLISEGILNNYDSINVSIADMNIQLDELIVELNQLRGIQDLSLDSMISEIKMRITSSEEKIEWYKSDIAMRRNSLGYFTVLSQNWLYRENISRQQAVEYAALLNRLLQATRQSSSADIHDAQFMLHQIEQETPALAGKYVGELIKHAQIILDRTASINNTIHELSDKPISIPVSKLKFEISHLRSVFLQSAGRYWTAIYIFAWGLAIIVVISVFRLQNSRSQLAVANQQLSESASRVRAVFENTAEAIFLHDLNGRILDANQQACGSLGYSRNELLELSIFAIQPELDKETAQSDWARVIAGEKLTLERLHKRKDGNVFPVELKLAPFARHGESLVLISGRDVSARKAAEAELKQHRENLEALVAERTETVREQAWVIDQIHGAVVTTDLSGVVTSWNRGAVTLLGYTQEEALGQHISFIHAIEDREHLEQTFIKPLKQRGEFEYEGRLRRKNGPLFPAFLSLSVLNDPLGEPKGMVGYALDITARKAAEQLLKERTAQLSALNKELETFSYSVSHDLRSPLRSIAGFSEALREDYSRKLDETGVNYLSRIIGAAQRMSDLIDDLLKLARVSREEMKEEDVDLSALAEQVIAELRSNFPERKVEVTISSALMVLGDRGLLRVVVENLLDNAWKYSREQDPARIEFGSRKRNGEVEFFVRDNGAGFDSQYAGKLFGAFQRLHRTEEYEGTGIGLATVQRIIHRHAGEIWAESEPGHGATFFFTVHTNG